MTGERLITHQHHPHHHKIFDLVEVNIIVYIPPSPNSTTANQLLKQPISVAGTQQELLLDTRCRRARRESQNAGVRSSMFQAETRSIEVISSPISWCEVADPAVLVAMTF